MKELRGRQIRRLGTPSATCCADHRRLSLGATHLREAITAHAAFVASQAHPLEPT